jgi:hypothetical protein
MAGFGRPEAVDQKDVRQPLAKLRANHRRKHRACRRDDEQAGQIVLSALTDHIDKWARHSVTDQGQRVDLVTFDRLCDEPSMEAATRL